MKARGYFSHFRWSDEEAIGGWSGQEGVPGTSRTPLSSKDEIRVSRERRGGMLLRGRLR